MNQTTWNKTTKKKFLAEAKRHRKADRFIQGQWIEEGKDEKGMHRGSFFTCMMQTDEDILSSAVDQMKLPAWLIHVSEKIFEGLPKEEAKEFPVQLLEAIPVKADMTQVWKDWNYAILMDEERGQYKYCGGNQQCEDAVKQCAELFRADTTSEAAARSAWSAAESAARSARSAWSARIAAESAWSAAWSAESARTAEGTHYQWMRDTLIGLLENKGDSDETRTDG